MARPLTPPTIEGYTSYRSQDGVLFIEWAPSPTLAIDILATHENVKVFRREGSLIFVASVATNGDWAAHYSSNPEWSPERVATNWSKTTWALAQALFPQFEEAATLIWRF